MISLATYSSRTSANVCGLSGRTFSTISDNEFVVQPADVIFVSAMQCDRQLLECSFSGVSSVRELLAVAGRALGNVTGLVTLHFRNRDRGCSLRRAVRFHPSAPLFATA